MITRTILLPILLTFIQFSLFAYSTSIRVTKEVGALRKTYTAYSCVEVTTKKKSYDHSLVPIISKTQSILCKNDSTPCRIEGKVYFENGLPVPNVKIVAGPQVLAETNEMGEYSWENNFYPIPFEMWCEKMENNFSGVSTLDILKIQRHILGFQALGSPYKIIAADVNKSRSLTAADLVEIRKIILGRSESFPRNNNWRFIPADFEFFNPMNPLGENFPEKAIINTGFGDCENNPALTLDFIALKIGDVSSLKLDLPNISAVSRSLNCPLSTYDQEFKPGETMEVPLHTTHAQDLAGFQFTIQFDPTKLEFEKVKFGVLKDMSEENFGFTQLEKGLIAVSWNTTENMQMQKDESLFSLQFKAKKEGLLSETIEINSSMTEAMGITQELEVTSLSLSFMKEKMPDNIGLENVLFQNAPNPFQDKTIIRFALRKSGDAAISVFDAMGRFILEVFGSYDAGIHEVGIDRTALNGSGVYYYQLSTSEGLLSTKKMLIVD
jgi:large repetitive protein